MGYQNMNKLDVETIWLTQGCLKGCLYGYLKNSFLVITSVNEDNIEIQGVCNALRWILSGANVAHRG